ncbi:MAG: nucleotidyltransferase domain-containing protein [Anaerolineae bacterium]|nr:nucleotidyltransferase domain-containing protein [Anaerolineae bacterium]
MIDKQEIKRVATQIGIAAKAERVVLFGSYAKGNADQDSDIDLLIVAESQLPRFKRSRMLYKLFRPYPFAMDLVVYTPQEIAKGEQSPVSFISRVLREGEVLYVRRDRDRASVGSQSAK